MSSTLLAKRSAPAINVTPPGANGLLALPRQWLGLLPSITVIGGPFRAAGAGVFGVCLLEGAVQGANVHMPIMDFQVPEDPAKAADALYWALLAGARGCQVYVGCMGGWGRTGLFLSLMAKTAGIAAPIVYVRKNYTSRAVETAEQERYVADFDVAPVRRRLVRSLLADLFRMGPKLPS